MGCIYVIENTLNGKKYVGQTGNWKKRERDHYRSLNLNKHRNSHLQAAWNKYGKQAFIFKVLVDHLPEKYLDDMERGFIATFRTMNKQYGYNKESGGNLNKRRSEESIEKNRQQKLKWFADGNAHPMQDKKHSPESIEKCRKSNLKQRRSPSTEFKKGLVPHNITSVKDSLGRIYSSIKEAARSLGSKTHCHLSTAIKNNKPYKGLYFTKIEPTQYQ